MKAVIEVHCNCCTIPSAGTITLDTEEAAMEIEIHKECVDVALTRQNMMDLLTAMRASLPALERKDL